MWVLSISPIFTQNYHKTLTFFCVIVPNAATSTQQSIKEEGEIKALCGEWFFCCCQLLTAKIGQQRKEESDFLTGKEDHGAWMELLWTTLQSTSKLPVEWLSVRSLLACIFLVFFRFCQLSVTLLHPFILCSLSLGNLPWTYIGILYRCQKKILTFRVLRADTWYALIDIHAFVISHIAHH